MTDPLYQIKPCVIQATGKRFTLFSPPSTAHSQSRNKRESGNNSSLTVSDVKVMHIPPKPLRASAMNISTDRAATIQKNTLSLYWLGEGNEPSGL